MVEPPQSQKARMKSSSLIQRKPLSNFSNLIPKSNDNKASSGKNPNCVQHLITVPTNQHSILNPPTPRPGDWVGDGIRIRIGCIRSQTMPRSKTKVASFGSPLRTKSNRIEVDGVEDALQSKSSTDPLPNNKNRKCLSKGSSKEYVMPQDFINQQRAYFKEIDEYELEVEEVE